MRIGERSYVVTSESKVPLFDSLLECFFTSNNRQIPLKGVSLGAF